MIGAPAAAAEDAAVAAAASAAVAAAGATALLPEELGIPALLGMKSKKLCPRRTSFVYQRNWIFKRYIY